MEISSFLFFPERTALSCVSKLSVTHETMAQPVSTEHHMVTTSRLKFGCGASGSLLFFFLPFSPSFSLALSLASSTLYLQRAAVYMTRENNAVGPGVFRLFILLSLHPGFLHTLFSSVSLSPPPRLLIFFSCSFASSPPSLISQSFFSSPRFSCRSFVVMHRRLSIEEVLQKCRTAFRNGRTR